MKKNCNIIRDLLPLYLDNVCSQESHDLVSEHLKDCSQCQGYLEALKCNIQSVKTKEVGSFKKFLKTVNFKIVRNSLIITVVILLGLVVMGKALDNFEYSVPYNDDMEILFWDKDWYSKSWNFQFSNTRGGYAYGTYVKTEEDGKPLNLIFITWKTNLLENMHKYHKLSAGPDNISYDSIDPNEQMKVYYTKENLEKIESANKNELEQIIKNSKLIFTKDVMTSNITCHLLDEEYNYALTYYKINKQIIKSEGDNNLPHALVEQITGVDGNYKSVWFPGDSYDEVYNKINDYMKNLGGSCKSN